MPCHATVCVNFILGAKVLIFTVISQSTGLVFLPSLPIGKKLGSNSTFLFSKKLCAKFNSTHRVIFLLSCFLYYVSIACFGTCIYLSSQSCLFDCERYKLAAESITQFFSKLRAAVFFAAFFLKRKRVLLRTPASSFVPLRVLIRCGRAAFGIRRE